MPENEKVNNIIEEVEPNISEPGIDAEIESVPDFDKKIDEVPSESDVSIEEPSEKTIESNTENDDSVQENSENSEVPLDELCEICSKYNLNEISQEELLETISKIKVISYLPLFDKVTCVAFLLMKASFSEDNEPEWQIFELEQYKFWDVLLKYTNIKTEGFEDYKTVNNYDAIYSAIGDYILLNCFSDYQRTIQMFESTINIYNIKNLLQTFANFDDSRLAESSEKLNEELESIAKHSGLIDKLAEILINKPNK